MNRPQQESSASVVTETIVVLNLKVKQTFEIDESDVTFLEVEDLFERIKKRRSETDTAVSDPLFRGLANASWGLQTTLERYSAKEYTVRHYFEIIRSARPEAQSFAGKTRISSPTLCNSLTDTDLSKSTSS
jgi:hypothetical protein